MNPSLPDILLLLTIPHIGPARVRQLLSIFGSAEEILRAPLKRLCRIEGIDQKIAGLIKAGGDKKVVAQQLEQMEKLGVCALSIWDDGYPPRLKKTADPPAVLFYRGRIPEKWPGCLGIVGTRMPTAYGQAVTERLVTQLVENGIAVVSGMARGIDSLAHDVVLRRGGLTYAVLGCGVEKVYPPENRKLYAAIQEKGAVFSEYFIGTKPDAINFPRRNRIISGMSVGVLVVEAGEKSGALITANYALEQNREVFAVPGNINSTRSAGTNRLIQAGAKLVTGIEDIIEEISAAIQPQAPVERPLPENLGELERQLLQKLSSQPKHIDRLVLELEQSPALILARLLTLELQGLVRQLAGKMFIRI